MAYRFLTIFALISVVVLSVIIVKQNKRIKSVEGKLPSSTDATREDTTNTNNVTTA